MSHRIRSLAPEDAALFRQIRIEALRLNPEAFGSTYEIEAARPQAYFIERLTSSTVFAGFDGAALDGVAGFRPEQGEKERHKATLWGMYVRPAARGRGLGTQLVQAVLAHARGRVERVLLTVVESNYGARRLYTAAGFVEYGLERHALKQAGRYDDEVLMAAAVD